MKKEGATVFNQSKSLGCARKWFK